MKHRLFLPALMCCLTLAAFGFFVFALVRDSMRNTPQTDWEGWKMQVTVPEFDLFCRLAKKYGVGACSPSDYTNDRIIGVYSWKEKPSYSPTNFFA